MAQVQHALSINSGAHRGRVLTARDKLVTAHLHLVPPIARRIQKSLPPSFDLEDLISDGNLGLLKAAIRYRPKEHGGCPFSAFARPKIHGAIMDSVRRRHGRPGELRYHAENTRAGMEVFDQAVDSSPGIEESLDRRIEIERLRVAFSRLTALQQRILAAWHLDTDLRRQRAGWRKGRAVSELHTAAIDELRTEYRRAA